MLGGLKWCELFLILYRTPYSTKLKVNKTDVVTVCLFRIFTFEQITVAKHLVVLKVLKSSDRSLFQHSGLLSCQLTSAQFVYTKKEQICVRYTFNRL